VGPLDRQNVSARSRAPPKCCELVHHGRSLAGVSLRDVQLAARHADPWNSGSETPYAATWRRWQCETFHGCSRYDQQVIAGAEGRPPLPPGKALKFLVEDPVTSSRSSTWRIWTGKKADDLYVCETKSGEGFKTSLHNEGEYGAVCHDEGDGRCPRIERVILSERARRVPREGWSEALACSCRAPTCDARWSGFRTP